MICEVVSSRWGALKSQDVKDKMFHPEDLLLCVGVVGDVAELGHVRGIDLLVFSVKTNFNLKNRQFDKKSFEKVFGIRTNSPEVNFILANLGINYIKYEFDELNFASILMKLSQKSFI